MRDIESQRLAPTTADHRANRTPSERCNALLSCISKLPVPDCRRVPFLNHYLQVRTEESSLRACRRTGYFDRVATEQDPERLVKIFKEIIRMLDEKAARLFRSG
jgi:hypothetical protein